MTEPDGTFTPIPPLMTVVTLKPSAASVAEALGVIDQLRADIVAGRAVGFAGVTISPDDEVCGWSTTTQRISRLRMMGAVSQLLASMHANDI